MSIDSKSSDAYIGLARSYFKDGSTYEAIDNLRKALILDPTNKEAKKLFNKIN